jgi:hypothetical protein
MLVEITVSSMNTSRLGSSRRWLRPQRRRIVDRRKIADQRLVATFQLPRQRDDDGAAAGLILCCLMTMSGIELTHRIRKGQLGLRRLGI